MAREILIYKCNRVFLFILQTRRSIVDGKNSGERPYVTSLAKIEQITRCNVRRARGRGEMRGKIMEKPSVPMTRLVIRKRTEKTRQSAT